jgi:hypothetical protein
LFNGLRFSFTPFPGIISGQPFSSILSSSLNNKLKPRKIEFTNTFSKFTKTFESLTSAAAYIKQVDGASDRATMRKYINSDKLSRKIWIIHEIEK